jgi:hypothetical protein
MNIAAWHQDKSFSGLLFHRAPCFGDHIISFLGRCQKGVAGGVARHGISY